MWKRYQETKSYSDYVEYKRALNRTTQEYCIIRRKTNVELKLAQGIESNHKSLYFYVRSKSRTTDKVFPLKDNSGNMVSDDKEMCKMLITFFSSVCTNEFNSVNMPDVVLQGGCDEMLSDIMVNEDIFSKKLLQLKLKKAPGLDGFVPRH